MIAASSNGNEREVQQSFDAAIQNAKKILYKFANYQLATPKEQKEPSGVGTDLATSSGDSNLKEAKLDASDKPDQQLKSNVTSLETKSKLESSASDDDSNTEQPSRNDAENTVNGLVSVLDRISKENQQLKFRNLLYSSQDSNSKSKYEVEMNLQTQQFEKIKSQLQEENKTLRDRLNGIEYKVTKYKNKIREKNTEINRLTKILNENSVANNSQSAETSTNSIKKRSFSSTIIEKDKSSMKEKASGMLTTLGLLATHVLDSENKEKSAPPPKLHHTISDNTMTENEFAQGTDIDSTINSGHHFTTHGPTLSSQPTLSRDSTLPPVSLPKMKKFSTVDGSVRDL